MLPANTEEAAMNVMPNMSTASAAMTQPRARIGLIIPSVNTYSEPQFNRFAPEGLGIHVARVPLPAVASRRLSSVTKAA